MIFKIVIPTELVKATAVSVAAFVGSVTYFGVHAGIRAILR